MSTFEVIALTFFGCIGVLLHIALWYCIVRTKYDPASRQQWASMLSREGFQTYAPALLAFFITFLASYVVAFFVFLDLAGYNPYALGLSIYLCIVIAVLVLWVPRAPTEQPIPQEEGDDDLPPFDGLHKLLWMNHEEVIKLQRTQYPESNIPQLPSYNPNVRFEHTWITAGSGHGKTQLIQFLIASDLRKVQNGEASVIVIDSQGDLIRTISNLRVFAPGHPLHEKLVVVDPHDILYPISLNLFDVGGERMAAHSPLDRERLTNSIIELYDFVLGTLLQAEMTSKQSTIFRYITRLMLHIPGATIHTLRELLEPKGYEQYKSHIQKLEGTPKAFFDNEFNSKQFAETKQQVLRRLYGLLENQAFERMFSHTKSKLDIFTEMNAGKVILINTAKDLLKQNGTQLFGRFFIALIAQAAQERATLKDRKPCYVYIDEFQEYADKNIATILEQARKYKIGLIVAHQYLGQLDATLVESLAANTSIKFAGGVSAKDARALEGMLGFEHTHIQNQPPLSFIYRIKGFYCYHVQRLQVLPGVLERLPKMTKEDRKAVRQLMRQKYSEKWEPVKAAPPTDLDNIDL